MRTTIQSICRYGNQHLITLACGHTLTVNADQLKSGQFYIGKKIAYGEMHHPQN